MQKSKMAGEALEIAVKRREVKSKGEKERYKQTFFSNKRGDSTHGITKWSTLKSD